MRCLKVGIQQFQQDGLVRGDYLILSDTSRGQASREDGKVNDPYTDIWVYKSGKSPKVISLEKMLYL
jgi:hypothetical protein